MSIAIQDVEQLAQAIAVANGHPAPPEWAAKVLAAFSENTPAAQPVATPPQDSTIPAQ